MCEIKNDLRLSKNGQKPLIYIEKSVVIYVFGESISTTPKRKVARSNRAGDAKTAVMRRLFSLSKIPAIALSSSRDFHILPEKF